MKKYFVPEVITINEINIPSTPYKSAAGKPIFLGDIFEVKFTEDGVTTKEIFVAVLKDGTYSGECTDLAKSTPMIMFEDNEITVLGNENIHPELLNLLTK